MSSRNFIRPLRSEALEIRNLLTTTTFIERPISCCSDKFDEMYSIDVDGDSDVDIVDGLSWFANDGSGKFADARSFDDQLHPVRSSVSGIADTNNDGIQEILVHPFDLNAERIATGSTIVRQSSQVLYVPLDMHVTKATDVDGDGDQDIIGGRIGGLEIYWFENLDSTGTFGERQWLGKGTVVDVVDMDGDGDSDVVTYFDWHENTDGKGTFVEREISAGPPIAVQHATDVDRDGDIDAVAFDTAFKMVWLENGSESWQSHPAINQLAAHVNSGDLDGDGDQDLYAELLLGWAGSEVVWFENVDGDGTYAEPAIVRPRTTDRPGVVISNDLDGDGDHDLLVKSTFYGIVWFESRIVGDSNNDGRFNSTDLVRVFQSGEYDDGIKNNSTFEEGDWNRDGEFDSSDLVLAFQSGAYLRTAHDQAQFAATVDLIFSNDDKDGRAANKYLEL